MEVQAALGAEIVMAFDECPPGDAGHESTKKSLDLTIRWAAAFKGANSTGYRKLGGYRDLYPKIDVKQADGPELLSGRQALFGIIQGAGHLDLRSESLERTVEIGFDGYAIGGLSVGEEKSVMYEVLEYLAAKMPEDARDI